MYLRAARIFRRAVVVSALLIMAVATMRYASAQTSTWAAYVTLVSDTRALAATHSARPRTSVTLDVPYRGANFTVRVPVATSYLAAARGVDATALFGFNRSVRAASFSALDSQQRTDPFVEALAERLVVLRQQLRLSDDDYVDLMARAVQAIPYGTLHRNTYMPAVTVAQGRGVCADKSVLLWSLLRHEGYDAGIWVFPTQEHAAVALRGTGPGFRGSGYTLIETTDITYVGEIDQTLRAAGPICEEPQLIVVGSGGKRYTRDLQTEFIAEEIERAQGPRSIIPSADPAVATLVPQSPEAESQSTRDAWIHAGRDRPDDTYALLVGGSSVR
ncbi:MAG: hypothetical protein HGB10_09455 [Coriobacteriia bacterium]|nr:hypothetical protein [Coriobacteriia bacterium]